MILLTLTFTTATFAWVSMGDTNRVDGLSLTAATDSNLEFSLDGINWTSNLDEESLGDIIKELSFIDLSSIDGVNFISKPDGNTDMIYPNRNYFTIELHVRTTTRYRDVYLVNNVSNDIDFDNTPDRGTFITSEGITFRSSVDFLYDVDEIRNQGVPFNYYAKDAMRISVIELKTDNPNDTREERELNRFIFDPSENEHRSFGKPYGAISYYNAVRLDLIDVPSVIPETIYQLTTFSGLNKYQPDNTNSRALNLIQTDNFDADSKRYYEGKMLINIWLEGYDADSFDSIFRDKLKIQLEFQSALPIEN